MWWYGKDHSKNMKYDDYNIEYWKLMQLYMGHLTVLGVKPYNI